MAAVGVILSISMELGTKALDAFPHLLVQMPLIEESARIHCVAASDIDVTRRGELLIERVVCRRNKPQLICYPAVTRASVCVSAKNAREGAS
jgi:hypothetical protein